MPITTTVEPSDDINLGQTVEVETSIPTLLVALADLSRSIQEFLLTIPVYSSSTVTLIEKKTRGQYNNSIASKKGKVVSQDPLSTLS